MYYAWNGIYASERGEMGRVLFWHALSPVHLLMTDSAGPLGQHIWDLLPGQAPKTTNLPLFKAR